MAENNGDMTSKERFNAYLDLYREDEDMFHKLEDIEWRANFGVWTLLAGAVYFLGGKEGFAVRVPQWLTVVVLLILLFLHLVFLVAVIGSQQLAASRAVDHRFKMAQLLEPYKDRLHPGNLHQRRRILAVRISFEGGMTAILCAVLYAVLVLRPR